MARPHRVQRDQYLGKNRYFLTICCHRRARRFDDLEVAALVREQLLRSAARHGMAIHAYCLVPDHLHALCEGADDHSDFLGFLHAFKQRSAYAFARGAGERLWQPSYFDRHLRAEEDLLRVARYIFDNPVRAGLVTRPEYYPHSGSTTLPFPEILASMGEAGPRA